MTLDVSSSRQPPAPKRNAALDAMIEQIAHLKAELAEAYVALDAAQREVDILLQEKRMVLENWRKTAEDLVHETERANRAEQELEKMREGTGRVS